PGPSVALLAQGSRDAAPRHAARAGGPRAGVAPLPARLRVASPDATVPCGYVGGADARVQRGPGVLFPRLRHHVLCAAPYDLRVLRSWARTAPRAARARRHVAGRAV